MAIVSQELAVSRTQFSEMTQSHAISHFGFDARTHVLSLIFTDAPSTVYLYQFVTPEMFEAFGSASSKGKWVNQNLRPFPTLHPVTKVPVLGEIA